MVASKHPNESYAHQGNMEHTRFGDSIRHAGEQVGEKADQVINKSSQFASDVQENVKEYTKHMGSYIKENPIKSTLIAGVAGIVLGWLFKRRK
ncbi:MAG: hypothetical protein A3F41_02670 [Coxiella sp. RIFCSPHIGHO2_12_FULL_44_14]|nr:MAG: hypothetical protein A3F41_02670 [Coxiella sp. RIFCSPHIGHO2_12_FULL_44_14]